MAWPLDVHLVEDQQTASELRVHVGVPRLLRFERSARAEATVLQVRVTDPQGRELLGERRTWPAGEALVDLRVALLPGHWTITAEDEGGARFAGSLEVAGVHADDGPQAIAPAH